MDFSTILKEKYREELEKLAGDEDQINEIVLNSEPIQHLFMEKDLILAANRTMAEDNLALKPRLEESRNALIEVHNQLASKQDQLEAKQRQLQSKRSSYSPDSAAAILQASAAEAEQNSEVIADGFVRGEIDVRDFLKEFLDARAKSYDLKHKAENMVKVFQSSQNRQSRPSNPSSAPSPYPNQPRAPYMNQYVPAPSQPNAAVPYPSVPYGQPQQQRQQMPYPTSGAGFPAYPPGSAF
ncbi:Oidioi.mRNA.OKI2018_I69.PAR.g9311.t1.cds [Oikopleura dioica]|uniref:Oidioi.mRNA.OKI2018_I69.PAR.g9311.t1.cds n=1 Tax=Oikopleura dioica TaxID=34765 RepID=A0ABN7RK14_OIKDI|nr:Oidioi.mRNA.OKI2018_I69.PAR.g9311.t1.cds [Oikopleura dioica]